MMELPTTITKSNISEEYAPWMDTITTPGEQVFREKSLQFAGLSPLTTGPYVITATVQANPTIASRFIELQGITIDAEDTSELGASFNYQRDITTGSISQMMVTPSLSQFRLVSLGIHLAKLLVRTLDQIRAYNGQAIYPIMSILEPYIGEAEELVLDMPPISSIRGIARAIDRGTAEPEFNFE
jgi:hypothetical protein